MCKERVFKDAPFDNVVLEGSVNGVAEDLLEGFTTDGQANDFLRSGTAGPATGCVFVQSRFAEGSSFFEDVDAVSVYDDLDFAFFYEVVG